MSESESDGWFVVRRHKTSTIKFAMAGSQDWWYQFPQSLVYRFYIVRTYYSGVGTVAATAVLAAALLQSIKNFIKN